MLRNQFLILFFTAVLLCSIIPAITVYAKAASVSGTITSDTIWTKANSPYDLSSNVYVNSGVTLTVEPGVVVNYNGHSLYVNGTLNAQGTETQKIHFNAGIKWDGIGPEYSTVVSGASKISYATLSGRITLNGDIQLSNCFLNGEIGIQGGSPTISNNYINGSMFADGIGLYSTEGRLMGGGVSAIISDNEIVNCYRSIAITTGDQAAITRNYLHNNTWAIVSGTSAYSDVSGADSTILNNTIENNVGGITVIGRIAPVITGNNLENNQENSLTLAASKSDENESRVWGISSQDATYNWWGTIDPTAISQSIVDHTDNSPSGTVTFTPYLTEPNPQAMPNAASPAPTASPTPTQTHQKITRVQTYTGGTILSYSGYMDNSTGQQVENYPSHQTTAALNHPPQQGNVLIATIGYAISANGHVVSNITSITQGGVTWTRQVSQYTSAFGQDLEIWLGVVGQDADSSLTINLGGPQNTQSFIIALDVCEYSGVATVSPLDRSASNSGFGSTSDTGQTAVTTKADELWVGAIYYYMSTQQTDAKNGFAQVGGDPSFTGGRLSTAFLEKIVDEQGVANTGTTDSASPSNWGGCIATFFAAGQADDNPSPATDNIPKLKFSCQSAVSSTIRVNIKGNLTLNGAGMPNEPILFSYSVNNGISWNDLTTVNTDNAGGYTILWTPSATGNYLVKAVWAGNADFAAAEKIVNFAITPYDEGSYFSLNSNSTLSTLSFDSAAKQLSFTVSGPTGTSGYIEVYVPKSLMNYVSGLSVNLDGHSLEYSSQSMNDAWLISFTYHHSTHQVTMNLAGNSGVDSLLGWILIAAIIVPLALIVTVIALQRGKKKESAAGTNQPPATAPKILITKNSQS